MSQPGITRQWALPNSRQAISHYLKERESQDVLDMLSKERVSYHDFMDEPWGPSERSWTKDSVGDVSEFLSISEPCRDVTRSQQVFETNVKPVKSLFPLDMDCFKVN